MSLLAAVLVFGAGLGAATIPSNLRALRRKVGAYRAKSLAAFEAQHHAPPFVHREPGEAAAALGPALTKEQIADMEIDDCIPAADIWCAYYPPGSLGEYPEHLPDAPGQLGGEPRDIEDLLTGAIRHLRDMAR